MIIVYIALAFMAFALLVCGYSLGQSNGETKSRKECKDFPYKCWTFNGPHDTSGCGVESFKESETK